MNVTRASLADDLRRLGLQTGDALIVHSSLRSLGQVEGGAEAVIGGLLDVLGPNGLLVLPAFTYYTEVFDPATTPGATGRVAEAGRQWPGAVRSWHPFHSVAAIGAEAEDLTAGHHLLDGAMAIGSPLDRLAARGGYVLLLGVGHTTNSMVHLGEGHAGVPYLDIPFGAHRARCGMVKTPAGDVTVNINEFPGCSTTFGVVELPLRERGLIRDGRVGRAAAQLMPAQAVIDATVAILQRDPVGLLCTDPACYRCTQAWQRLERQPLIESRFEKDNV